MATVATATHVLDTLAERGFVNQVSDEAALREALSRPQTMYCGFDATATSLHVGNLVAIMTLAHFQRHGHRPIALLGGGTTLVGDPTGRSTDRPILTMEEINANTERFKGQMSRYLDFSGDGALMVNNADWLTKLLYIPFLREVGRHFSVNQMLAMETYRTRLETGLSFLEFNYLLLQSYDFLHLYREHGCVLQVGGGDQWSNCLGGMDLIRRADGGEAFVMTTPLIATASGEKMGKSAGNAVWLDPARTSPYDYYQFWINTEDADVGRFLAMFTFLPMDEVRRLGALEGAGLRAAKERLAFEATALTHGEAEAREQRERARGIMTMKTMKWNQIDSEDSGNVRTMGWNRISQDDTPMSDDTITLEGMKSQEWLWDGLTTRIPQGELEAGLPLSDLFVRAGLVSSRNEARRLASQGGASVDLNRVDDMDRTLTTADIPAGGLLLRAGKKRYQRIVVA